MKMATGWEQGQMISQPTSVIAANYTAIFIKIDPRVDRVVISFFFYSLISSRFWINSEKGEAGDEHRRSGKGDSIGVHTNEERKA